MPRMFLSPPHLSGEEFELVREAFDSGWIAPLGPMLEAFERAFAEMSGIRHCLALSSGTAALHLGLRMLGVGPGDVVLASTLTFVGGVAPAAQLGAELAFVDCDRTTWTMDPALLEEALETYAREGRVVRAVMPTDLYGHCADYDRLQEICDRRGVSLLVDAAESVGSRYKGRHAGQGARAAAFSFNGNKIITAGGGGLLASDDGALIAEARRLSQQARDPAPHYEHSTLGYNYRLSNVLAAIGLGQLRALPDRVERRREIFDEYREFLGRAPGVTSMPEAEWCRGNRWLSVVLLDREAFGLGPEEARLALEARDIESRPLWKPMHLQPVFRDARVFGGAVSEELFARGLCLPSGTAMTREDVRAVSRVLLEAAGKG